MRPVVSAPPPGGYGMITRTAREGQDCADAELARHGAASVAPTPFNTFRRDRLRCTVPSGDFCCRMIDQRPMQPQSSIVWVRPGEAPAVRATLEAVDRILTEGHVVLCLLVALRLRLGEASEHPGREDILPEDIEVLLLK